MDNNPLKYKRLTIISGHYGSGKTNIAVNIAKEIAATRSNVALADLDIVNPYFRSKDSELELKEKGIRLICSLYANSNVDIPALPQEIYAITDDKSLTAVLDIGGDDRGAYVLGRLAPEILKENDYEMLMVINKFRPLTPDAESTVEVMREIEAACRMPFTGIINNSNLGVETSPEDVISSMAYAKEVSKLSNLPLRLTTAEKSICDSLDGVENLFPLQLQKRPVI